VSILSDKEIISAIDQGQIVIDPLIIDRRASDPMIAVKGSVIQPATVDLHLGPRIGTLARTVIDRYGPDPVGPLVEWSEIGQQGHRLYAREFLLCATLENITIEALDLVGILCGKSTLARDGLQVEAAGLADPGWSGNLTLELCNMGPATLVLRSAQPICQIYFIRTKEPVMRPYGHRDLGSHYQGATTVESGYDPTIPAGSLRPQ